MNNKFECAKCKKTFRFESEYSKHINKKISCDVEEKKEQLILKRTCEFCGKTFTRHNILTSHIATVCGPDRIQNNQNIQDEPVMNKNVGSLKDIIIKMQSNIENLTNELNDTKSELKEIKDKQSNNNYDVKGNLVNGNMNTQNTVNNIHNDIKIIAYGKEDLSHITDENYRVILNKGFKSVPQLVEYIHFNENKPENQNIYISNMRDNNVLVFDGKDWLLKERNDILQEMIDEKTDTLNEKFDELIKTLDEGTIKKFNRFLNEKDNDNVNVTAKIKKELKLMLYNKKLIKEVPRGHYNGDKKRDEKNDNAPIFKSVADHEPIKENDDNKEEIIITTCNKRNSAVKNK